MAKRVTKKDVKVLLKRNFEKGTVDRIAHLLGCPMMKSSYYSADKDRFVRKSAIAFDLHREQEMIGIYL